MSGKIEKVGRSPEIGQTNTPIWGLNLLRRDALVQLMHDLSLYEETGIEEALCKKIKLALAHLVNQASAIPDDSFFFMHRFMNFSSTSSGCTPLGTM